MSRIKSAKYWTAFRFKGVDPNELHITHKFLGEQSHDAIDYIEAICSAYFRVPREFPFPRFDRVAMFGAKRDIRVLLETRPLPKEAFFPELRAELDHFRPDDFGGYIPHVSTAQHQIVELSAVSYVLMCGKQIYAEWPKADE